MFSFRSVFLIKEDTLKYNHLMNEKTISGSLAGVIGPVSKLLVFNFQTIFEITFNFPFFQFTVYRRLTDT